MEHIDSKKSTTLSFRKYNWQITSNLYKIKKNAYFITVTKMKPRRPRFKRKLEKVRALQLDEELVILYKKDNEVTEDFNIKHKPANMSSIGYHKKDFKASNNILVCKNDVIKQKTTKNTKAKKTKPEKNKLKKDIKNLEIVNSKSSCHCMGIICNRCSHYWTNTKNVFQPTKKIVKYLEKVDLSNKNHTKKHKRKKKDENCEDMTKNISKAHKMRSDSEATRKYRLSTYLSDQEWIKRRQNKHIGRTFEKEDSIAQENNFRIDEEDEITDFKLPSQAKDDASPKTWNETDNFVLPVVNNHKAREEQDFNFGEDKFINDIFKNNIRGAANVKKEPFKIYSQKSSQKLPVDNDVHIQNTSYLPSGSESKANSVISVKLDEGYEIGTEKRGSVNKRVSAESIIKFGNPLYVIKSLLCHIFGNSKKPKTDTTPEDENVNRAVVLRPAVQSCSCQYITEGVKVQDRSTQIAKKKHCPLSKRNTGFHDAAVEAVNKMYSSATQYDRTGTHNSAVQCSLRPSDKFARNVKDTSALTQIDSLSSTETLSSITSDEETKTDTTICSLVTIDYVKQEKLRKKMYKHNIITKANQSTLTEKNRLCDVSTVTSDWWSPIVEKKQKHMFISLEKKDGVHLLPRQNLVKKRLRNRGVSTGGRIVKFRSDAQIIPNASIPDIMSPSRFLLESQKYYNELFTPKFHAADIFSVIPKKTNAVFVERAEKNIHRQKHRSGVKKSKINKKPFDRGTLALKKADRSLLNQSSFVSNDHVSLECHFNSTSSY